MCRLLSFARSYMMSFKTLKPKEHDMSDTQKAPPLDTKLEIVVIPVSDIDRAKRFYGGLGWRLDAEFAPVTTSG